MSVDRIFNKSVRPTDFSTEPLQPGVADAFARLRVADREPDAGEPVRDDRMNSSSSSSSIYLYVTVYISRLVLRQTGAR